MIDFLYYILLATFFAHELDAVKRHEWRVLPLTSFLPEKVGEQVFIWAHIPLLTLILWADTGEPACMARLVLSVFAIIHVGLHIMFRNHPAYEFNNASSWGLIVLIGILGAAYLAVVLI